ncbi:hypothetical protein ACO0SA_000794 [Hanseniaspora valbyensis]
MALSPNPQRSNFVCYNGCAFFKRPNALKNRITYVKTEFFDDAYPKDPLVVVGLLFVPSEMAGLLIPSLKLEKDNDIECLKSAATNCTNGQLNNNAVANRTNHLNLTTKNFKGDDFILNKLEFIVSQLKAMDNPVIKQKPELKLSDEFLLYTKGIDNTGGCHTLGLNLPVNEDDPYKQLSFKNRYGSTLPIELIQLKNHLPEISIGCYSMQYMGYDKDWYDLAKKLLVDVKLRSEIMSKFDSLKYRTLENENNDDSKK